MREVPLLGTGHRRSKYAHLVALVDEEDFARVMERTWVADKSGHTFYAVSAPKGGPKVRLHNFLLPDAPMVDHINGNGLDNQRHNLRACTKAQNQRNVRKQASTSSRYKGVYWHQQNGKWLARAQKQYLGCFSNEEEAAIAYDKAALSLFGAFAQLNFPELAHLYQ